MFMHVMELRLLKWFKQVVAVVTFHVEMGSDYITDYPRSELRLFLFYYLLPLLLRLFCLRKMKTMLQRKV